jgi:hypothetical protein
VTSSCIPTAVILSALLSACAHAPQQSAALPRCTNASPLPQRLQLTLSPASFGRTLSLQQQVHIAAAGHTVDLDAALDITARKVTLVGLMLGQRVLTLTYSDGTICEWRHPKLPAEVHGADILTDLEVSLWPAETVRAALPLGWTLTESANQRVLAQDSHPVELIAYDGPIRWIGQLTLHNVRYDYQLVIHSALAAP